MGAHQTVQCPPRQGPESTRNVRESLGSASVHSGLCTLHCLGCIGGEPDGARARGASGGLVLWVGVTKGAGAWWLAPCWCPSWGQPSRCCCWSPRARTGRTASDPILKTLQLGLLKTSVAAPRAAGATPARSSEPGRQVTPDELRGPLHLVAEVLDHQLPIGGRHAQVRSPPEVQGLQRASDRPGSGATARCARTGGAGSGAPGRTVARRARCAGRSGRSDGPDPLRETRRLDAKPVALDRVGRGDRIDDRNREPDPRGRRLGDSCSGVRVALDRVVVDERLGVAADQDAQ